MIRLLCTDLDRTLLPNGRIAEPDGARARLAARIRQDALLLAYVTGRDEGRVRSAIARWQLPAPDFVLADAGTEFLVADGDHWQADTVWQSDQRTAWHGADGDSVHAALGDLPSLIPQEPDRQRPFKRSYLIRPDTDEAELAGDATQRLAAAGLRAALLFSHDPLKDEALLDVVPSIATKHGAIRRLTEYLQLATEQVMFAGDSGNDLDALVSDTPGVLVGNADETTRRRVQAAIANGARADRVHTAQAAYAGGILEGLDHYKNMGSNDD